MEKEELMNRIVTLHNMLSQLEVKGPSNIDIMYKSLRILADTANTLEKELTSEKDKQEE